MEKEPRWRDWVAAFTEKNLEQLKSWSMDFPLSVPHDSDLNSLYEFSCKIDFKEGVEWLENSSFEVRRYLYSRGGSTLRYVLYEASGNNSLNVVQYLLSQHKMLRDCPSDGNGLSPVVNAASNRHLEMLQFWFDCYGVENFKQDAEGALVAAVHKSDYDLLQWLDKAGFPVKEYGEKGLSYAVTKNMTGMVDVLLEYGVKMDDAIKVLEEKSKKFTLSASEKAFQEQFERESLLRSHPEIKKIKTLNRL